MILSTQEFTNAEPKNKFIIPFSQFSKHDFIQKYMSKNALNCPPTQKVCVNALHPRTRELRIYYADFTQPLTQDDTVILLMTTTLRSLHGY